MEKQLIHSIISTTIVCLIIICCTFFLKSSYEGNRVLMSYHGVGCKDTFVIEQKKKDIDRENEMEQKMDKLSAAIEFMSRKRK